MKKRKYIYLLALLPFIVVAFMYEIIPLAKIIVNSFQPNEGLGFTLENYQTVFTPACCTRRRSSTVSRFR